jgi:hypothetical protein
MIIADVQHKQKDTARNPVCEELVTSERKVHVLFLGSQANPYWTTARTLKNLLVAEEALYIPGFAAVQFSKSGLDSSII